MSHNPILAALARDAEGRDLPISGVTVYAPLVSGPALMCISYSGMASDEVGTPDAVGCTLDAADLPAGVGVMSWSKHPESILPLPALTDAGGLAVDAAWRMGAWDLQRVVIGPGHAGALPPSIAPIERDARAQGLASWYWRPMLRGPEIRVKAWAASDLTLNPWSLARFSDPPVLRIPALRPDSAVTIRLGTRPAPPPPPDLPQRPWLSVDGDRIVIALRWHRAIVEMLRGLPGRRYDATDKTWSIPMRKAAALMRIIPSIDAIVGLPE